MYQNNHREDHSNIVFVSLYQLIYLAQLLRSVAHWVIDTGK